jgi:hypothetical protein
MNSVRDQHIGPGAIRGLRLWVRYFQEIKACWWDDVVVISFPKAGRTWHRVALCKYFELLSNRVPIQDVDIRQLTRELGLPTLSYSHTGANFVDAVGPYHYLNAYPELWRGRKIILLLRDPKDMLVSGYFHAFHRTRSFTGSLSEYIRHPFTGIEKLLIAHRRWHGYQRRTRGFLVQRYEDMHHDPNSCLANTLDFMGIRPDESAIAEAVKFSSFRNMKSMERTGYFNSRAMRSATEEGAKVREGKVGGYLEHMTAEDIEFVDMMIEKLGYPFEAAAASPVPRSAASSHCRADSHTARPSHSAAKGSKV